jgi:hypothetical protein
MDWVKTLIEKHTKDGKFDQTAFLTEFNTEFPKNAVPKEKYNELAESKKKLEKDVTDRDGQLEELKKTAGASEDLKKQIETLQTENKTAKEKYEADMKDLTLSNAIKLAVAGKVHDEGIVANLIDRSKLVIDGEKVVGLEDQLKGLKESKAFLFKEEAKETKPALRSEPTASRSRITRINRRASSTLWPGQSNSKPKLREDDLICQSHWQKRRRTYRTPCRRALLTSSGNRATCSTASPLTTLFPLRAAGPL